MKGLKGRKGLKFLEVYKYRIGMSIGEMCQVLLRKVTVLEETKKSTGVDVGHPTTIRVRIAIEGGKVSKQPRGL